MAAILARAAVVVVAVLDPSVLLVLLSWWLE
jgi:hypothetical protein